LQLYPFEQHKEEQTLRANELFVCRLSRVYTIYALISSLSTLDSKKVSLDDDDDGNLEPWLRTGAERNLIIKVNNKRASEFMHAAHKIHGKMNR
jgi:hypothetical protein